LLGVRCTERRLDFSHAIKVAGADIQFSEAVKLLGITLDTSLSFDQHVTNVVRACNFHLRSLRHPRPSAKLIATAIIGARIHYFKILYGTAERNFNRLQKVQNATARIAHQASFQTSATALRQQLHWLPGYPLHVLLSRVIKIIVTYLLTYLLTDQTTDHVGLQAGDPYFHREVLSCPTVSSRTASRPPGCQETSIQYRSTALPTICVHRIRLSGILLLCTSCLELFLDLHKIGEHFQNLQNLYSAEVY